MVKSDMGINEIISMKYLIVCNHFKWYSIVFSFPVLSV